MSFLKIRKPLGIFSIAVIVSLFLIGLFLAEQKTVQENVSVPIIWEFVEFITTAMWIFLTVTVKVNMMGGKIDRLYNFSAILFFAISLIFYIAAPDDGTVTVIRDVESLTKVVGVLFVALPLVDLSDLLFSFTKTGRKLAKNDTYE